MKMFNVQSPYHDILKRKRKCKFLRNIVSSENLYYAKFAKVLLKRNCVAIFILTLHNNNNYFCLAKFSSRLICLPRVFKYVCVCFKYACVYRHVAAVK